MDNCVCQEYGLIWGLATIWGLCAPTPSAEPPLPISVNYVM